MCRRSVVVLFQHHLFGAAIARALGEDDQLKVTLLALHTSSRRTLKAIHPDAIVLEGPMTGDVGTLLLGVATALTVVVGPEANTAEVFERHEVIQATVAEITTRIMAAYDRGDPAQRPRSKQDARARRRGLQVTGSGPK